MTLFCGASILLAILVLPEPARANGVAGHAADPCLVARPPGHAHGRDHQCPRRGGSGGVAKGDFNGDGTGDLAIGVPDEDVGKVRDAGAVHVIYGTAGGLNPPLFTQAFEQAGLRNGFGPFGGVESPEVGDHFGAALAAGDFDSDGFSDLAIGAPDEDLDVSGVCDLSRCPNPLRADAGVVHVLYGSSLGLTSARHQGINQGYLLPLDTNVPDPYLRSALDVREVRDSAGEFCASAGMATCAARHVPPAAVTGSTRRSSRPEECRRRTGRSGCSGPGAGRAPGGARGSRTAPP